MAHRLRVRLRQLIRRSGYDLAQRQPTLPDFLRQRRVNVVFDVGANVGQFGTSLRQWGYTGRIVSFEPLRDAYAQLATRVDADPRWTAVPVALGAREAEAEMHVSDLSVFSSLRTPLDAIRDYDARSATVGTESVVVRRLDAVFDAYAGPDDRVFLKIDTQGYEADVLDGAAGVLSRVAGVQLELSTRELYAGETLADAMVARLAAAGFQIGQVAPVSYDPDTGYATLLQFDTVFVRPRTA